MSKVVTTTVLPDVDGSSLTLGASGDNVVVTGNDFRANVMQDAGGNALFTSNGSGVLSGLNSSLTGDAMKLIATQTASSSASINFTTQLTSTYDAYQFSFIDIHPATNSVMLMFNGSTDGSNYNVTKTTSVFRSYSNEANDTNAVGYEAGNDIAQGTGDQSIIEAIGNENDECGAGELWLFAPSSTSKIKHWFSTFASYHGSNYITNQYTSGYFNTTSAITAVTFKFTGGNIDSGIIKLYGISKT